jgi:Peptidase_C39 like family
MKKILLGIIVVLILGGAAAWITRHTITRIAQQATLPEAVPYISAKPVSPIPKASLPPTITTAATPAPKTDLPQEVNLAVPFTAQAPHANWEDPYREFCEEASVLMAISYLNHTSIPSAAFADKAMLAMKDFEDKRFGFYKDTNAEETAIILKEHFSYKKVEVKQNPTAQDIKQALANGRVVIVPVAGRQLHNPYFQQPGPLYHMIVIKGYTANGKFISHDPGTRRGADFLYSEDTIMNAIHDWRTDENINLGKKVVIFAG